MAKLLLITFAFVASIACAEPSPSTPPPNPIQKVSSFELTQVRLLDSPFKQAQELDRRYLLSIDPNSLLLMFRVTAGLPGRGKPVGGWEGPGVELRGHTLGHYLTACSQMYQSTGDPELKQRVDAIVADLAECQAAMPDAGYHAGYLSAFPESFFNRVDAQKPVWAPWYTMHKILAGLIDAHLRTGNAQALEVATKLADWIKFRVDRLTPEQMQASLKTEHGGMNEALANLYAITNNPEHLRLAEAFYHHAVLDPLARGEDKLDGLHANTQIPKVTGLAREYELTGKTEYRDTAKFFWQQVALKRSYALGGDSDNEHFFPVTDFAKHLTPVTAETCNTYNMLKLTEHLFAWEPSASLMDFYERGLYNQILASQDPKTGMMEYFVSMRPGHFKTYSTPENSFWCCVGTGMENHGKYGGMIYSHDADALYVNLFIPSEVTWTEKGVIVQQENTFPNEPKTRLRVTMEHPAKFTMKVRQPAWCASPIAFKLNGAPVTTSVDEAGYVALQCDWRNNDVVEISLPMTLRTEPLPGDPKLVAVFYGPILLAGALGTDGMPAGGAYANDQGDYAKWPAVSVPTLNAAPEEIVAKLEPISGDLLTFRGPTLGVPQSVVFMPFYRLHHQRYTVYWQTK
jgi:DUF1680 family protein